MRLITYTDPRLLHLHPEWEMICSAPHVCATESLTRGLQELYGPSGPLTVISANLLFSRMLPGWFSERAQLQQYARLTGVIQALQTEMPRSRRRLRAFRRNQEEVLDAIRTLAEGGLTPEDLDPQTRDEKLFQEIWKRMERDERLKYLKGTLFGRLNKRDEMRSTLLKGFAEAARALRLKAPASAEALARASDRLKKRLRLILHGFYFITPVQQRMIELLRNAGVELIFLACWDDRRAPLFAAWEAFFEGCRGSTEGPEPEDAGRCFAAVFTGDRNPPAPPSHLRILRFPDLTSFLEHVDEELSQPEPKQAWFCSPLADELNEMLREFYPDRYPDRHFLSYPIGQFLFHLHRMWDEESSSRRPLERRLRLTREGLFACFGSGLLRVEKAGRTIEGRALTGVLRKALPFFEGCEYLADWLARGEQLRQVVAETVPQFDPQRLPGGANDRFHAMLANPLRRVGYLQLTAEEVADLMTLLERLSAIACELFAEPVVSLSAHMKKLAKLLEEGGADRELLPEEQKLFRALLDTLNEPSADDEPLPTADLAEAIAFYLGTVAKKSDSKLVSPLEALDGLPLRSKDRPIHLCLLGEEELPAHRRAIPWPLTRESFKNPDHPAVRLLVKREDSSVQASLYLFYSALAFSRRVTLSWVARWKDEPKEESLYLLMLRTAGIKPIPVPHGSWARNEDLPIGSISLETPVEWPRCTYPPHAAAEFVLCPRRFYYSYVAADGPSFDSPYHHGFLYSGLWPWYQIQTGADETEAEAFLDQLFPQLTKARKKDYLQRFGETNSRRWDAYEARRYPYVVRRLILPGISRWKNVTQVFNDDGQYQTVLAEIAKGSEGDQMRANPGLHCRYCPHITHCRDARYPVDPE